jgi:hypothetical protein
MLGLAIRPILESLVKVNQLYLLTHHVPLLYESGVRYQNEPPGLGYEDFAIIPSVLRRGWGDCDDLAPWRVAELRQRYGEKAKIRIQWKKHPKGKLFHIVVRRGSGLIEDPSAKLGMGKAPEPFVGAEDLPLGLDWLVPAGALKEAL